MKEQPSIQPQVSPEQIKQFAEKEGNTVNSCLDLHFDDVLAAVMVETRESLRAVEAAFCYGYKEKNTLPLYQLKLDVEHNVNFALLEKMVW